MADHPGPDQSSRGPRDRDGFSRGENRDRQGGQSNSPRGGRGPERRSGPRRRSLQAPSQRARQGDPARSTAYLLLRAVDAQGAYANLELPRLLRRSDISGRDAAFATELAYGTLRMQGLYDAIITAAADRSAQEVDAPVRDILRLGIHQLLAMRVPDHAAVSATVALAREHIGQGAGGFVNAILRRVSEQDRDSWIGHVTEELDDELTRLSVEHSHPVWVVRALRTALGAAAQDELPALLAAHNTPGPLTLAARPGLVDDAEMEDAGATPHPLVSTAWILPHGDPGGLAAVREGRVAVQDAGSQLLTLALVEAPVEGRDEQWLDLCAGPGGKAGLLAALALQRGASLRANEVTPHRADLVRSTLKAAMEAGAQVEITTGDGREIGEQEPEHYDRILVDAPCTGLGALRRRPEARWRRTPADLATLAGLQRELLDSAIEALRPGGVVAYATCSPHIAETHLVVQDLLKRRTDVELLDVHPLLRRRDGEPVEGVRPSHPEGDEVRWAQLWPHRHDTDGMFVALLRRSESDS